MNEHTLHSAIKQWYSLPGAISEVNIGQFVVDVVQGSSLVEVQTRNFSATKKKLQRLVEDHKVRLVYPIAKRKWISRVGQSGELLNRRKSPKKGRLVDLFYELVRLPDLIAHENFVLEVLLIEEEEVRCNDGRGSWRRRGVSIKDRKLIRIVDRVIFNDERDLLRFLPKELPNYFTNRDLAVHAGISVNLACKMTYCLKKMGAIAEMGKRGRALLFRIPPSEINSDIRTERRER